MWTRPSADRDADRVDRVSRLFTLAAGRRRSLAAHKKPVDCVAWNRNGTKLASASRDMAIRVWSADARGTLSDVSVELKGHTDDVARVSWHPTHTHLLASCSADKSVKLWDTAAAASSGKQLLYSMNTIGMNLHLRWSPDGKYLLLLNSSNLLSLISWDPQTNKLMVLKSIGFALDINDFAWAPIVNTAATGTGAGAGSVAAASASSSPSSAAASSVAPGSDRVILGHHNGSLEIVSIPALVKLASIPAHGSTVFCMDVSPNGKLLATGAADSMVHLWELVDLVPLRSFMRMDDSIRALSFNADGSLLAYGGKDLRIEIADVATGARVALLDNLPAETLALAFNPALSCSMQLAYATGDKARTQGEIHILHAALTTAAPSSSSTAAPAQKPATVKSEAATADSATPRGVVKAEPRPSKAAASSSSDTSAPMTN